LLRSVGYRRQVLSGIIVSENLVLLIWGLAFGAVSELLSILPALRARGMPLPALYNPRNGSYFLNRSE